MINKVTLVGRIGNKNFRQTKTGRLLCQFSVATEDKFIDSMGNQKKETTWHNLNFFDKRAENANKYNMVSDFVYIEGQISNRTVVDDNGVNRKVSSITGDIIRLLSRPNKDNSHKQDEIPLDESHIPADEWETENVPF